MKLVASHSLLPSSSACYLPHASLLFGLFFDPEDGGDMFLRNVGLLSTDDMITAVRTSNPTFSEAYCQTPSFCDLFCEKKSFILAKKQLLKLV
jgi:hypothetical protein